MRNRNRLSVLLLAGLVLLMSGCGPRESETALDIGPKVRLETGLEMGRTTVRWLDVKDGDKWDTTSFRPFVTMGSYAKKMNWDITVRALFTTQDEVEDTSVKVRQDGVEFRYRLGWGWTPTSATTLSVLTGLGYRHSAMEFKNTGMPDDPVKYSYYIFSYTLGARLEQGLGKKLRLTGEFSVDAPLAGRADVDSSAPGDISSSSNIDRPKGGYILAGRAGLEWHLTKNLRLGVGGFAEQCRFKYKGNWDAEDDLTTTGGYFSLIFRF